MPKMFLELNDNAALFLRFLTAAINQGLLIFINQGPGRFGRRIKGEPLLFDYQQVHLPRVQDAQVVENPPTQRPVGFNEFLPVHVVTGVQEYLYPWVKFEEEVIGP